MKSVASDVYSSSSESVSCLWRVTPDPSSSVQVLVMNSIRKPKRLTIRGDDERDYMFLVKAGEDLRLDQRIEEVGESSFVFAVSLCPRLHIATGS